MPKLRSRNPLTSSYRRMVAQMAPDELRTALLREAQLRYEVDAVLCRLLGGLKRELKRCRLTERECEVLGFRPTDEEGG